MESERLMTHRHRRRRRLLIHPALGAGESGKEQRAVTETIRDSESGASTLRLVDSGGRSSGIAFHRAIICSDILEMKSCARLQKICCVGIVLKSVV